MIINDIPKFRKLKMELAITIDAMAPFVKATYTLEGDGLLALIAYREISKLHSIVSSQLYPNVLAVAKHESRGDASNEQLLIRYAKNCVRPAYDYFQEKFDYSSGDLKDLVLAFKAARFFSPVKMNEIQPTPVDIEALKAFPFIDDVTGLKAELPAYLSASEDVSASIDISKTTKMIYLPGQRHVS
jgi:hypothetical protein